MSSQKTFLPLSIILLGVGCWAGFWASAWGYNPTYDGFILACSRRLLAGQIPHRDFISVRPVLSAFMHLPVVALGGAWVYRISRIVVALEIGLIAWMWVQIGMRSFRVHLSASNEIFATLLVFELTTHKTPLVAWHTTDGIFLATVGFFCWMLASNHKHPRNWRSVVGLLLVGCSPLCKQNFALILPFAFLAMDGIRRPWWSIGTIIAPAVAYVGGITALGGGRDLWLQLTTHTALLQPAILNYSTSPEVANGILVASSLFVLISLPSFKRQVVLQGILRQLVFVALLGVFAMQLYLRKAYRPPSFFFFGTGLALVAYLGLIEGPRSRSFRMTLLLMALTWAASISFGSPSPDWLGGSILLFIWFALQPNEAQDLAGRPWISHLVLWIAFILSTVGYFHARTHHLDGDRPVSQLTVRLDELLPGGAGIRASKNVGAFLGDLGKLIRAQGETPFAILPDVSGYRVKSKTLSPLSVDWPQMIEFGRPELQERVIHDVERLRTIGGAVLVERRDTYALPWSRHYPTHYLNPVVDYIRTHLHKEGETEFFEIYR